MYMVAIFFYKNNNGNVEKNKTNICSTKSGLFNAYHFQAIIISCPCPLEKL